jgi:hypothetical protein
MIVILGLHGASLAASGLFVYRGKYTKAIGVLLFITGGALALLAFTALVNFHL